LPGAVMQQGIHQRVFFMAGRRMHDHARRLVEHAQRDDAEPELSG
jgi:hypothetical protein